MSTARLELDLEAFRTNVRVLAATAAPAAVMVAVKSRAYGHGLVPLALAALDAGATWLGALEVEAGIELRDSGVDAPVFVWLHRRSTDFSAAVRADLDLGVSSVAELERVARADGVGRVHLKVDTGLHRNGATPAEWPDLVARAVELERRGELRVVGLWSHLADASPEDDAAALEVFVDAVRVATGLGVVDPLLHLAASSAGIRFPSARFDLVRFGIAAYGFSPFDDVPAAALGLRPAMSLVAGVVAVDAVDLDGAPLEIPPGGRAAILDVGTVDGLPSLAAGRAEVRIGGRRCAVIAIGLEELAVVVDGTVAVGDEALVYGSGDAGEPTAAEWAAWGETIADEIVARASERLPRRIID